MDFADAPEEAAYRAEVRAWLEANAPKEVSDDWIAQSKDWQRAKHAAGYTGIAWPKAVGGRGQGAMRAIIFNQEEARTAAPASLYAIGLGMCIPTVLTHGSPEIVQRYVGKALEGSEVWCQLFSEPAAGSDLAGVRTRAVREGDDWVVNGQKVWTTNAQYCDFGIIICRTDPSVPKHKGLTMFIVDMHAPGVDVRPLKQMSGASDFNEIFFTDVRIPDSHRLGAVGDGWKVALTTLMNERLAVGGKPRHSPDHDTLIALAKRLDVIERADVRGRIADVYIADEGIRLTQMRALSALSKGEAPGPEQSIAKLVVARTMQELGDFALDLGGASGFLTGGDDPDLARLQGSYLWSAGLRIAGGTDEILRNIIAERVLGLPGDLRPDKDLPFNASEREGRFGG